VRGELARLGVDRGRAARVAASPIGAVHGQVGVESAAQGTGVAETGAEHPGARDPLGRPRRRPVGAAQRLERRVRTRRQQPVLHPQTPARRTEIGGPVTAVEPPRPAEEGAVPGGEPFGPGGGLQHHGEELLEQRLRPLGRQALRRAEHQLHLVEELMVVLARQVEPAALPAQQMPYDHRAQHRDPLGGDGDQAAPAQVREPALGEGELVVGEEGAAVGRAPRRELNAGQLRCLGGGEGARRGLREQRGRRVGGLALPPRGPLVLEVQDVDVTGLREPGVQRGQCARGEGVVAVQEQDVGAGRRPQPGVAGPAQAGGGWRVDRGHPGVPPGVAVGDVGGRGAGGVADRDQLEVAVGLREDRVQGLGQPAGDPVGRDDDAEAGHSVLSPVVRRGPGQCARQALGRPVGRQVVGRVGVGREGLGPVVTFPSSPEGRPRGVRCVLSACRA
jgi:hypothetical protein